MTTVRSAARRHPEQAGHPPAPPRIVGVGTANPPVSYRQVDLLDLFGIHDAGIRSLFLNGAIERRHLCLPPRTGGAAPGVETQAQLLAKHRTQGVSIGAQAVRSCLKAADADVSDIHYLCCVSSTGWLTPGFSALLMRELDVSVAASRLDVVGMGCNAGLNGLNPLSSWAAANPGKLAVMVCIEVCSAAYVFDGTVRTAVVNSLFGDGAAAVAVVAADPAARPGPRILRFASHLIPSAMGAMRYDWDSDAGKFSFYLDREIPYVVGAHAESVVDRLLTGTGLRRSDIAHWVVHSGGKKVIDAVRINLGLTVHDVRHTTGVLRDYGNLSSGSFLFSYERLLEEGAVRAGDYAVLMTMGPGSTIETALVQW